MDALLLDGKLPKAESEKLLRIGSRISLISKSLYAIVLYLGSKNVSFYQYESSILEFYYELLKELH